MQSACLSILPFVCLLVCLYLIRNFCLSINVPLRVSLPIHLNVYNIRLPVCFLRVYLSIYMYTYLPVCLSIYISVCLSICAFMCPSECRLNFIYQVTFFIANIAIGTTFYD